MGEISLDLGELSIALRLDNDAFRQQLSNTKRELEGLPPVAEREVRKISQSFDREGKAAGGKLAEGINQGLIRNSPIIAAAIGGALTAGAPLAIAGATVLFGGIAAVALSQNAEVAEAWRSLGKDIRDSAVADASVLVPTYTNMASRIGEAFQQLRPQLREAFADSAGPMDTLTTGIIALAQNAMPGLVRAVASSGPVFDGLNNFLASTGTGLTGFFDAISGHSPAAGAAFAGLGDVMGELLPLLGELLGQGVELAAMVLPPLAAALGVVTDAAQTLGPLLPIIAAGFGALKIANTVTGMIGGLGTKLATVETAGGRAAGAAGKVGSAIGNLGSALPVAGLAIGVLTSAMAANEAKAREWAQALLDGGNAAQQAMREAGKDSIIEDVMASWTWTSGAASLLTTNMEEAEQASRELWDSLSPIQQAQQNVTRATNDLSAAQEKYGVDSGHARGASVALREAQAALEQKQRDLEVATRSTTSALVDQAMQALAAGNADLQYRQAMLGVEQSQQRLNEVMASGADASLKVRDAQLAVDQAQAKLNETMTSGTASSFQQRDAQLALEQAQQKLKEATEAGNGVALNQQSAQLAVEQSFFQAAAAADAKARADNAGKSEAELNRLGAQAQLATLEQLATQMGVNTPAAIRQQIAALQASAGTAAITAAQMRDLGLSVVGIPNSKYVDIKAPTGPQMEALRQLGVRTETLPNGNVRVFADTGPAASALAGLVRDYQGRVITMQARVDEVARSGRAYSPTGSGGGLATGGPVRGPGTGTSDTAGLFALSNNEHVWTAREVAAAGGHGAVEQIRQAVLQQGRGLALGGAVTPFPVRGGGGAPSAGGSPRTVIYDQRQVITGASADAVVRRMRDDQRDQEFLASGGR